MPELRSVDEGGERIAVGDAGTHARLARAMSVLNGYAWEIDLIERRGWTSSPATYTGFPHEAFGDSFESFARFIHPDDIARVQRALLDHLDGRTAELECEYRLRTSKGDWLWVLDRARVTAHDEEGRARRLTGLRSDITMRKHEEERQRLAQEAGRIGTYEIDMADGSSIGNAVFLDFYGLPPDHGPMSFDQWHERIHPEDRASVLAHVKGVLGGAASPEVEYRVLRPDGSVIWTASRTAHERCADGRYVRAWGVQRDITEQKLAAQALAQREAELATIYGQALVGICYRRIDGQIITANDRYAEILGRSLAELEKLSWRDLTHPDDASAIDAAFTGRRGSGEPISAEVRYRRPDGTTVWCNTHLSYVRDARGVETAVVIVIDDISEQKRAQADARRLQARLERAGRTTMASTMGETIAHELQQPHAAIANHLAAARYMLAGDGDRDRLAETLQSAEREALRAGAIVRQLRNISGADRPDVRPDDLQLIVDELLASNALDVRVWPGLQVRIETAARAVEVDRVLIQQVLADLIGNAIDASPPDRAVEVVARRKGQRVEVSVVDEGIGVTDEVAGQLFEPFVTTKADRLGLGLATARTIVEAHEGRIRLTRRDGRTIVSFTIRAAAG